MAGRELAFTRTVIDKCLDRKSKENNVMLRLCTDGVEDFSKNTIDTGNILIDMETTKNYVGSSELSTLVSTNIST